MVHQTISPFFFLEKRQTISPFFCTYHFLKLYGRPYSFVQNVNRNCLRPFYNRLVSLQVLELRMCIYSAACMMWVSYLQKNCMLIFKKKKELHVK